MTLLPTLDSAKRITVKVGSALVCDTKTGVLKKTWLCSLADDIAALRALGKEVILVSSGSVTLGRKQMQAGDGHLPITVRQAAAACGQPLLLQAWQDALSHHNIVVGQNLLTAEDSENRRRYVNSRNALNAMLECGVIPIVNENDTVTTSHIRYGDNDRLAARVASMTGSDALVLLSDIDGLYTSDPKLDPEAELIPVVETITPEIEAMGGEAASAFNSGGMRTKIIAAQMATAAGCSLVITRGDLLHPLQALRNGGRCTWFTAEENPLSARKHWIAASQHVNGAVVVDDGAKSALLNNSSLLAAGITLVDGTFSKGDTIWIRDHAGENFAKGISAYDSSDLQHIMGLKSHDIEKVLGFIGPDAVIHRDDMVLELLHAA